jgi:hypothetical protein
LRSDIDASSSQIHRLWFAEPQDGHERAEQDPVLVLQQHGAFQLSSPPSSPTLSVVFASTETEHILHSQTTLFIFCALNELFFVALYVLKTYSSPLLSPSQLAALPAPVFKLLSSVPFLLDASWAHVIAAISAPVMAGKQAINVVQFWKAAKLLNEQDLEERWEANEAKKGKKN